MKRKEYYEKRIENEVYKAKECLKKNNKSGAKIALRNKNLLTKKLETIENNYMLIQEQILQVEGQQLTLDTFSALQHAAKAQKATMAKYKVEKVDDIMDEIKDANENFREIQQALEQNDLVDVDEFDLEAELEELEAQELDKELLEPVAVPSTSRMPQEEIRLPEVPKAKVEKAPAKTTEEELAELERELAS